MAQESGSWQCKSQSESKYLRTRVPRSEGRKRQMSQLKQRESIAHPLPFCSIQALNRLDTTYPHWWGQPSLLSLPIQMLISSRNTLTDWSRNNVSPAVWASLSLLKLIHKMNHHTNDILEPNITYQMGMHLQREPRPWGRWLKGGPWRPWKASTSRIVHGQQSPQLLVGLHWQLLMPGPVCWLSGI